MQVSPVALTNIVGLVFSTIAAVLMYYFPPRGVTTYADDGSPIAQWRASPTREGKAKATVQRRLGKAAPVLLAIGFLLQLAAAVWPLLSSDG